MSASHSTTKDDSKTDDTETPKEPIASTSQENKDDDLPVPDDAEKATPTGAVQALPSCQTQSDSGGAAEEEETLIHAASSKPAAGHATKSLSSASSSMASSGSLTLSPGRAKMSVSGPSGSKSSPPLAPSSSPSTSASPSVSPGPPKIHRARKTMSKPSIGQHTSFGETASASQTPSGSPRLISDPESAVLKKRKLGHLSDSRCENIPDHSQTDETLFHKKAEAAVVKSKRKSGDEGGERSHSSTPSAQDPGNFQNGVNANERSNETEEHCLETETPKSVRNDGEESSWSLSGRGRKRSSADLAETEEEERADEYTEVPLGDLDLAAADSLTLSPPPEGSDAGDTERLEELPLCSCRMEAPRIDSSGQRSSRQCMATESINGELRACTSWTVKGETMRPSSRVSLMVLCDVHRSHMVKHHCCPGCGYFCIAGTFLECCPDQRIAHRFHRGCVTVLSSGRSRANGGGMIFCPHCGEDASEAQEITLPSSSAAATVVTMSASSTTTPSLPLPPPPAPPSTPPREARRTGRCRRDPSALGCRATACSR
ncbi:hypothetical protein OJAV_G00114480 [Oryzias javanicus]|uniref:EHMT1/2 cysteine-rich region domain-containing protein n=1 Tax=Oryzias javanicus TaxID=123683 RepID=A0A3S2PQG7_ORYJA|nr:hypothetical protein OJAV_G00114480 [Oryzias javanicus]